MKKFFTLFGAAAITLSVSAVNFNMENQQLHKDLVPKTKKVAQKFEASGKKNTTHFDLSKSLQGKEVMPKSSILESRESSGSAKKMRMLSARKVDGVNSVEGAWTFSFGDYYFQSSIGGTIKVAYEATLQGDNLVFQSDEDMPFVGVFDASASTISFYEEYLADSQGYQAYQVPFEYNYGTNELDNLTALIGRYNATSGTLSFSSDQGLAWEARSGSTVAGYFGIYDFEGATHSVGSTGGGNGLEGTWEWTFIDDLFDKSTGGIVKVTYVCEYEDDYDDYYFSDPTNNELPFYLLYDASTGIVTLPYDILGSTGSYLVTQEGLVFDANGNAEFVDDLTFRYDATMGAMIFDQKCALLWGAYDPSSYQPAGYFGGYILDSAKLQGGTGGETPGEDNDWTNIGNAKFMDGWVLPAFGIDQTDESNWYEVPLQQNVKNEYVYRLVDPYKYGPAADFNASTTVGYIEFDVTDPAHVTFNKVEAGFRNSDLGITKLYCYNQLTFFMNYYGVSSGEIISALGDGMPYTTFENGVVDLGYIVDEDGPWYDANFGYQSDPDGGYGWQDSYGNGVNMSAKIFFPDKSHVSEIAPVENEDAVYFNLQGVKVSNPEKGQLLIVRKGSKSEKVIF